MFRQRISILLILMMAITPIASAFSQCAGMMLSGHHIMSNLVSSGNDINSNYLQIDQKNPQHQTDDMHCHVSGSCSFHACGGDGIVASVSSIDTMVSTSYSGFEYSSFDNTVLSPDLRPPIFIL